MPPTSALITLYSSAMMVARSVTSTTPTIAQDGDHRQYRGQAEHAGQVQAVGGQTGGRDDIVQLVEHADRVKQQPDQGGGKHFDDRAGD